MTACAPTPEQREAVYIDLVGRFSAEATRLREEIGARAVASENTEREVLEVLEHAIGRVLSEWAPDGREARVAQRLHVELRLAFRAHFQGQP